MTPGLDLTPDFSPPAAGQSTTTATTTTTANTMTTAATATPGEGKRTLFLAPPSLAAREDRLSELFAAYPRATTDLQMLDRLAAGLAALPAAAYDLVLVLTDPDGARRPEAAALLRDRAVWTRLAPALRPGGRVRSEDG
ncbi:hypothetical protein VTH06DRAFT_5160, partial [Thermothelomyces fergusii]